MKFVKPFQQQIVDYRARARAGAGAGILASWSRSQAKMEQLHNTGNRYGIYGRYYLPTKPIRESPVFATSKLSCAAEPPLQSKQVVSTVGFLCPGALHYAPYSFS